MKAAARAVHGASDRPRLLAEEYEREINGQRSGLSAGSARPQRRVRSVGLASCRAARLSGMIEHLTSERTVCAKTSPASKRNVKQFEDLKRRARNGKRKSAAAGRAEKADPGAASRGARHATPANAHTISKQIGYQGRGDQPPPRRDRHLGAALWRTCRANPERQPPRHSHPDPRAP